MISSIERVSHLNFNISSYDLGRVCRTNNSLKGDEKNYYEKKSKNEQPLLFNSESLIDLAKYGNKRAMDELLADNWGLIDSETKGVVNGLKKRLKLSGLTLDTIEKSCKEAFAELVVRFGFEENNKKVFSNYIKEIYNGIVEQKILDRYYSLDDIFCDDLSYVKLKKELNNDKLVNKFFRQKKKVNDALNRYGNQLSEVERLIICLKYGLKGYNAHPIADITFYVGGTERLVYRRLVDALKQLRLKIVADKERVKENKMLKMYGMEEGEILEMAYNHILTKRKNYRRNGEFIWQE